MDAGRFPSALFEEVPAGLPVGPAWVTPSISSPVVDAWTGEDLAQVPVADVATAQSALTHAAQLCMAFAKISSAVKKQVVSDCVEGLRRNRHLLEDLLILETGKPRRDCRTEVARTISCWEASVEEVGRNLGELVPVDLQPGGEGMTAWYRRRPLGTVVAIAGFNYPLLLASHKIAPALAVGAPFILKPAPATPLSALWLVSLVRRSLRSAGLDESIAQCLTGGAEVGNALVSDERAAVVSFTGSAAVGHAIAKAAAPRRTVLELGSNAALIVTGSANLDDAVDAVVRGAFYANGQACISIQRIIVTADVAEDFEDRLSEAVQRLAVGDPWDEETQVAALIDSAAGQRVQETLQSARNAGARTVARREAPEAVNARHAGGALIMPELLADVSDDEALWNEEIFAPIAAVRRVGDLDEAFQVANDSRYGLQASIYTADLGEALRAAEELEVGGVVVNQIPGFRSDVMPYGGVRDSGVGREGPRWAMEEYTVTRMVMMRMPSGAEQVGER